MNKIYLISVFTAAIILSACTYGTTDAPVESMAETDSVESVAEIASSGNDVFGDNDEIVGSRIDSNNEPVTIPKESDSVTQITTAETEAKEMAPIYQESAINSENFTEFSSENNSQEINSQEINSQEINSKDINSFTSKIKQTFASKDLEALADLCGYPVYVSLQNGKGIEVNSRQAFLDLGSENIFTDSLSETIKSIDPQTLEVFGAGVVLGENANIIFNKVDGRLMITGINI